MIPFEQYKQITEVLPILCVDVIITNSHGEYLLVKRAKDPLKGEWWVIGGRVHKGETMEHASIRKVKEEVALDVTTLRLVGYYEEIFRESPFALTNGLHTVSVVFLALVDERQPVKLDCQSTDWKYSKELPTNFHITSFDGLDRKPL